MFSRIERVIKIIHYNGWAEPQIDELRCLRNEAHIKGLLQVEMEQRRLNFVRWLVQTGKLNEYI